MCSRPDRRVRVHGPGRSSSTRRPRRRPETAGCRPRRSWTRGSGWSVGRTKTAPSTCTPPTRASKVSTHSLTHQSDIKRALPHKFSTGTTCNEEVTIKYLGAWGFCRAIFIYFTREMESFICIHLRIGCISTMPCEYLFISPIFPTKIFIYKNSRPLDQVIDVAYISPN